MLEADYSEIIEDSGCHGHTAVKKFSEDREVLESS